MAGGELDVLGNQARVLHSAEGEICEEGEFEANVVLFSFFMLLTGLVAKNFLRKIPIPYTALLLIFGLWYGFQHKRCSGLKDEKIAGVERELEDYDWRDGYERLGTGIQLWTSIKPELLLLIFLPPLIFSSAFSLDFHIVKRVFGQVLLLAGPGVIIGTALLALVARYIFPYSWCWPKCLLFGAMLSATDPVAVVALLKEVGASAKLGTVIEGESLFNDGTAFVFFLLFRDMIPFTGACFEDPGDESPISEECKAEFLDRNVGQSVVFFIQLALGGPALGIAIGIFATLWIKFVFNDLLVEITITLVSAYLGFYLAEDVLKVSGVLTVVALGLFMGTFARDRVSARVHEPMHVFWELLEYFANTLIFVYTGVKVAIEIWDKQIEPERALDGSGELKFIRGQEWGLAAALYLFLQLARVITIVVLYPLLKRMGYGLTFKDAIVVVWGGLRGAVGLALALIVELDEVRMPPRFRALTIFYMGTMAAATLVINGATMPYLLKFLGTTKTNPEKLEVLLHVVKDLEDCGMREWEHDDMLGDPDHDIVEQITKLKVERIIPNKREVCRVIAEAVNVHNPVVAINLEHQYSQNMGLDGMDGTIAIELTTIPENGQNAAGGQQQQPAKSEPKKESVARKLSSFVKNKRNLGSVKLPDVVTQDMLVYDLRSRLLQGVKMAYAEWRELSYISAEQLLDLKESADKSMDKLGEKLDDWTYLERLAEVMHWRRKIQVLGRIKIIHKFLQKLLFNGHENAAIMARAFIHGHREAEHHLSEYIDTAKRTTEEAEGEAIKILEEAGEKVLAESREETVKAEIYLKNIRRAYPEIARSIKTKITAHNVLLHKLKYVQQLEHAGLIEPREANEMTVLIDSRIKKLTFHPPNIDLPEAKDLLHTHPLFSDLSRQTFDSQVLPLAKPKVVSEGQVIFETGKMPEHLTLVVRGVVQVWSPDGKIMRQEGSGAMIGMSEVLLNVPRARTLKAESVTEVYQIEASVFKELVKKYYSVRRRAWQMATAFLSTLHPWGEYIGMTFQELQSIMRNAELLEPEEGDEVRVQGNYYLSMGRVEEMAFGSLRKRPISAPVDLGPGPTFFKCLEPCKIMIVPGQQQRRRLQAVSMRPTPNVLSRKSMTLERLSIGRRRSLGAAGTGLSEIPEGSSIQDETTSPFRKPPVLGTTSDPAEDRALSKSDSEPAWRLEQAAQSADMQLRREAKRMMERRGSARSP